MCSSLAGDVCVESVLLCFQLKTIEQLNALKQSRFVGEERIHHVTIMHSSFQQDDIIRSLPVHVTKLNCYHCTQLTSGCFDALINLTLLNCSYCGQLTNGCFDQLVNLIELDCNNCPLMDNGCFDKLVNRTKLDCYNCMSLTTGCFDKLVNLTELCCSGCR